LTTKENVNMVDIRKTDHWTFQDFIEEIIYLSEISEVPGVSEGRSRLLQEVWRRFPDQCEALGLKDGLR
jgi:hypothetical protein